MSAGEHPLWQALSIYRVGPEGAALDFEARLARENGWSAAYAARVMDEYRRFLFLTMTAGHMAVPSEAVDQAWHLHLAYSRDYWDRLCGQVLGTPLHHGPTEGGPDEGRRLRPLCRNARELRTPVRRESARRYLALGLAAFPCRSASAPRRPRRSVDRPQTSRTSWRRRLQRDSAGGGRALVDALSGRRER